VRVGPNKLNDVLVTLLRNLPKDFDLVLLLIGKAPCVCAFQGDGDAINRSLVNDSDATTSESSARAEELWIAFGDLDNVSGELALPCRYCKL
jgi:hypothetical protein